MIIDMMHAVVDLSLKFPLVLFSFCNLLPVFILTRNIADINRQENYMLLRNEPFATTEKS
jgi:hypothetical protein